MSSYEPKQMKDNIKTMVAYVRLQYVESRNTSKKRGSILIEFLSSQSTTPMVFLFFLLELLLNFSLIAQPWQ